jgi:hypothetical protein
MEPPLCLGVWDEAVFHDIAAEAVSGLRVLSCRFHMGVANLIPELLQVGIWPCFEMLVKLWLVIAILDPEVNDLPSDTRGGKVKGGSGIEFDVLGRNVFSCIEELAMNIEDFHGKAPGLRSAVLCRVSNADRSVRNSFSHQDLGSPGSLLYRHKTGHSLSSANMLCLRCLGKFFSATSVPLTTPCVRACVPDLVSNVMAWLPVALAHIYRSSNVGDCCTELFE